MGKAWNIIRTLIALFVLYSAYRCAQISGMADTPGERADAQRTSAVTSAPIEAAQPACSPSVFTVKGEKFRREYDNLRFTATVVNGGSMACGVQLKISTYDKAGDVLDTKDFWPASVRNIAPGASENFSYFIRYDKAATNYDIVPIDARVWRQK